MKLDILCLFPIIIKAICVAGMFMNSQDCSIWYWMLPEERKKSRSLPQSDYPSYGNAVAMYFQDDKEFFSFAKCSQPSAEGNGGKFSGKRQSSQSQSFKDHKLPLRT